MSRTTHTTCDFLQTPSVVTSTYQVLHGPSYRDTTDRQETCSHLHVHKSQVNHSQISYTGNNGITRFGVTRGSNLRCHPYLFLKNWQPFFSHHRLSAVSSAISPYLFSPEKLTFFSHHCQFY